MLLKSIYLDDLNGLKYQFFKSILVYLMYKRTSLVRNLQNYEILVVYIVDILMCNTLIFLLLEFILK